MGSELVEIQPQILRFTCETKKQSTCTIQLTNKTDLFVAFKVKTTSPKKYCVKPNVGVLKPKGKSDFTVIMQAQTSAPSDLLCKDKFLVQSTVVAFGLQEENITSEMFIKDPSKNIHEKKLKVILVHPPISTESSIPPPVVVQKQDLPSQMSGGFENLLPSHDKLSGIHENLLSSHKDVEVSQSSKYAEETRLTRDSEMKTDEDTEALWMAKCVDSKEFGKVDDEKIPHAGVESTDSHLKKEVDYLSVRLSDLEFKLAEADDAVSQLLEERSRAMQDKEMLEEELEMASKKNIIKKVYMGYPMLYVCMVGVCSLTYGYLVHQ